MSNRLIGLACAVIIMTSAAADKVYPNMGAISFPRGPVPLLIHCINGSGKAVEVKLSDIKHADPDLSKSKELQRYASLPCEVGQVVRLPPSPISAAATGSDALGIGRFSWVVKGEFTSDGRSWNSEGTLTPVNGPYKFEKKDWGERKWWAEVVTRLGLSFPGKEFSADIAGTRAFSIRGVCGLNAAGQAIA